MAASAKRRFAELIGSARTAVSDIGKASSDADAPAVMHAASAASRAAGFLEAMTISDPAAARDMITDFESFVLLVENVREQLSRPAPNHLLEQKVTAVVQPPPDLGAASDEPPCADAPLDRDLDDHLPPVDA